MTISRKAQRFNPLVLSLIVLVIGILVVVAGWAGLRWAATPAPGPDDAQSQLVSQTVQQMIAGLDVLTISHYTADTVQDGQVRLPGEYQAARQNLQQLNQSFSDIQSYLEPQQAVEIEDALTTLQELVAHKQPASMVAVQVDMLTEILRQVGR